MPDEVDAWNGRLLGTAASIFQYPYWNEPLRAMRFSPRYLVYEAGASPLAYTCVLTLGVPGARIGLVQRGPVGLTGEVLAPAAGRDLAAWAARRGYIFLRFTHSRADVLDAIGALRSARRCDAFPFYREPSEDLLVPQEGTDEAVLARFQPIARRNLRKAQGEAYRIICSESPDAMEAVWPLFQHLASRKGFSYRPLESYTSLLRNSTLHRCARVYSALLGETLVEAILVVRDGTTAYYISGALDVDALGDRPSPSVLLHWRAMRDFAESSVRYYSLGTRSGDVYQFKRKFRPIEVTHPAPVTVVTNWPLYQVWSVIGVRMLAAHRQALKGMLARMLGGRAAATAAR
jgi:hypothetical protein